MSRLILGGELVWLGSGSAFSALTARRRDALEWLVVGILLGPLPLLALVASRPRNPESPRQRPFVTVTDDEYGAAERL
jgi:hypothetical protein